MGRARSRRRRGKTGGQGSGGSGKGKVLEAQEEDHQVLEVVKLKIIEIKALKLGKLSVLL